MKSKKSTPTPRKRRVAGIDPGYDRLGIAVLEEGEKCPRVLYVDCVETNRLLPHPDRLLFVAEAVRLVFSTYRPSFLSIERLYFSKNVKTALLVAEARGVILHEAARAHIPVFECEPSHVKIAVTGHGGSDKKAVQKMVERLVAVSKKDLLDDEYDAIAIALTYLATCTVERTLA